MALKQEIYKHRVSQSQCGELTDKTVFINRVAKVVSGGRRFSFSALVVTGDGQGHVGFGLGKSNEVPDAIRKGSEAAKKSLFKVPLKGSTIAHDIIGVYGPCQVILKPARPGTGVIAGSVVRSVIESAGIADIRTKCIGSSNPKNVLQATVDGLLRLRDAERVAQLRGKSVEEMGYHPFE